MQQIDETVILDFRVMQYTDLPVIMDIERQCYEFGWSVDIFRSCLKVSNMAILAILENKVIGYGIVSTVIDEASLLNICILPRLQGKGYAKTLLLHLCEQLRNAKIDTLFLEVRPSNKPALQLYHQLGFNQIGARRNYYPAKQGREDAWVFALVL